MCCTKLVAEKKNYSLGSLNIWPLGVTLVHVIIHYLWISYSFIADKRL